MLRALSWAGKNGVLAAKVLERGVPTAYLDELIGELGLSGKELELVFGLTRPTLSRRRKRGVLAKEEGERLYRLARLYGLARELLGEEEARLWLRRPHPALMGETPLMALRLEPSAREAEEALMRGAFGVVP